MAGRVRCWKTGKRKGERERERERETESDTETEERVSDRSPWQQQFHRNNVEQNTLCNDNAVFLHALVEEIDADGGGGGCSRGRVVL
jgi:hypothetical protein